MSLADENEGKQPFSGRALVVFSGQADLLWLRLLRPGFRHCFVVLGSPGGWISLNPMAHRTDLTVLSVPPDFDLAGWYRAQGLTVVETLPHLPPRRQAPWRPYSCVEAVKRVLGIHDGFVLTPWQLFRYLKIKGKKSLTGGAAWRDDLPINTTFAPKTDRSFAAAVFFAPKTEQNKITRLGKESAMGGFFAPSSSSSPAPVVVAATTAADTSADDAAKTRQETVERNRRGLYGTIATSETGLLKPRVQGGKSLLGE
ncbi:hypothetical protein [Magnetospirillum fulvum]|uniref:Uncharacterized protein n=1 Tax=Magnetospirillum fulvum TaxID=1082 RepID=A0A1H6IBP7_MAGFU|nr:hypothetical protein [Magnetospirillum fulvum]SEH45207.1 hypothetical protein SAMN04244559_02397 [Magnetospirillum fulvum]